MATGSLVGLPFHLQAAVFFAGVAGPYGGAVSQGLSCTIGLR